VANLNYAVVRNGMIWIGEGDSLRALPGRQVAWAPDGRHLAIAGDRGIVLRDANGQDAPELIYPTDRTVVENLSWGVAGRPLVFNLCQNSSGCDHVVSVERGPSGWTSKGIDSRGRDPAWSTDGSKLAVGKYNAVLVLSLSGATLGAITHPGHAGPVWAPAFAPDGKSLAARRFLPCDGEYASFSLRPAVAKP